MSPPTSDAARRRFFVDQAVVFAVIIGLCTTWVLMSEYIQGMQDGWQKPWFILYVIHCGYSLNLIIYYGLYVRRTGDWCMRAHFGACCCRRRVVVTQPEPYPVTQRQLVRLSVVLSLLSAFVGYAWYLSLNHTLASANNAIYQSASAFVFVLSYFMLGEAMTAQKLAAVLLAIGGVTVVILAPASSTQNSPVVQTVGGYLWVVASTVGYAVYEVRSS
jgi:drug/metabolite transporter (DMT)-like permease